MIRRVGTAVLAVDGFTGRAIVNGLRVRSFDGSIPVRKEDGFQVFWEHREPVVTYCADAPGYRRAIVSVDTGEYAKKQWPVLHIYLYPELFLPAGGEMLREEACESSAPEGWRLQAAGEMIWEESEKLIHLASPYDPQDGAAGQIQLACSALAGLEDRRLFIRDKTSMRGERLTPWQISDPKRGIWLLPKPLMQSYAPDSCQILLLYPGLSGGP